MATKEQPTQAMTAEERDKIAALIDPDIWVTCIMLGNDPQSLERLTDFRTAADRIVAAVRQSWEAERAALLEGERERCAKLLIDEALRCGSGDNHRRRANALSEGAALIRQMKALNARSTYDGGGDTGGDW